MRDRVPARKRETKALERGHAGAFFYSLVRGGTRMPSSESCSGSTGDGACIIKSSADAVLGNAITSRMLAQPAEQHHQPVEPDRDAAVRRRAEAEGVEQEAEPLARFRRRDPHDAEHPLLQLAVVDSDRAARELDAVEHDVVGERARRPRIAVEQRHIVGVRMGERMMHGAEPALVRAPLEQRKVGHPQQPVAFGPVTILLGERHPQLTQRRRRAPARRGDQEGEVAFGELEPRRRRFELARGERILDLELERAVAAAQRQHAGDSLRPRLLRPLVDLAAAGPGGAGNREPEDRPAFLGGLAEGAEAAASELAGQVDHLERRSQVGLVDAVARHHVGVGVAIERRMDLDADQGEEPLGQALHHRHHLVAPDERHLDVDLRELGLAVGAQVLVAEAAADLHVALAARDLEDLLEELRRLRQREEAAAVHARRHQIVARALGRRPREDRRLDVEEAELVEVAQRLHHHFVAQPQVALELVAAKVEVAEAEAGLFARLDRAFEAEGQRIALRQHLARGGDHLERPGRDLRVHRLGRAARDRALDLDHPLEPRLVERFRRRRRVLGTHHHLHRAAAVAQIEEDDAAVIAAPAHPGLEQHAGADVGLADGPGSAPHQRDRFALARRLHDSCLLARVAAHVVPRSRSIVVSVRAPPAAPRPRCAIVRARPPAWRRVAAPPGRPNGSP